MVKLSNGKELKVVEVAEVSKLEDFYKGSAFTILGLDESSFKDFAEWLLEFTDWKHDSRCVMWKVSGRLINNHYHLSNPVRDDLTIAVVELKALTDTGKLMLKRLEINHAKWFDDFIDNSK